MANPRMTAEIGRVLGGRYRLVAPIGMGASAQVYLADDVKLRRRVAVKMLHDALAGDAEFLRRFRAEARAAAALSHPNVMAVYDWSDGAEPGEVAFIVTEYLPGGSLRSLLDSGALLSPSQALGVGLEAARALDYAHRRGFVHRDIKPANLLFGEDQRLRIADFGLARALAEAAWTEPQGAVLGTARYASPEQAKGETLSGKADVYSLALVIIESVTGEVPFVADTTLGTLMARVDRPMVVPDSLGPLQAVVAGAGHPDPHQRIDARTLAKGLMRAAKELSRPAPLPLAGALAAGGVAVVDLDPTVHAPVSADQGTAPNDLTADDLELEPPAWVNQADGTGADGALAPSLAIGSSIDPEPEAQVVVVPPVGADGSADPTGSDAEAQGADVARPEPVVDPGPARPLGGLPVAAPADADADVDANGDGGHAEADTAIGADSDGDGGPDAAIGADADTDADTAPNIAAAADAAAAAGAGGADASIADGGPGVASADAADGDTEPVPGADASVGAGAPITDQVPPIGPDTFSPAPQRRRRWPWVALVALVVGALIAGGVAFATRPDDTPASPPIDLPVPTLFGQTEANATTLAEAGGWKVKVVRERRDGTRKGAVLESSPAAGARLAEGGTITLTVSDGQTIVDVPAELAGMELADALTALDAVGLKANVAESRFSETVANDVVIETAEGTPARLEKGSTVDLIVSKGPEPRIVPQGLVGSTESAAQDALEAIGLKIAVVRSYSDTVPEGQVISVLPKAGSSVARGTTVNVEVSRGPELVAVPDVSGASSISGAIAILEAQGLKAGAVSGPASGSPQGTSPGAGTMVRPGATIDIILG